MRRSPSRPWAGLALIDAAAVLAAAQGGSAAAQQSGAFADFPFVIYCQYEGIDNAYFFSQLQFDGRAVYLTLDRQVGAITVNAVAERIGGDRPGTCLDKTLDDLRAAGQAFDLPG